MGSAKDVRDLVKKLHAAHNALKESLSNRRGFSSIEPKEISEQRARFQSAYRQLFEEYLQPLDLRFRSGEEEAVNEVIDFLVIDSPAFRCGYVKEKWLRRLKSLLLTPAQKQRLKQAAISICASPHFRREMVEWNRLMIKLADADFVKALFILREDPNELVREKARRMLYVILNSRDAIVQPEWLQQFLLGLVLPNKK